MALDYFVTKFYKFPYLDKPELKKFFLADEIDKWGAFTLLVPVQEKTDILLLITVNNLSIFDRIEEELLGFEIDPVEYANAGVGKRLIFFAQETFSLFMIMKVNEYFFIELNLFYEKILPCT